MKILMNKSGNWGIVHHDNFEVSGIKKEVESYYSEWLLDTSRQEQYITHQNTFMYQLIELDYMWSMKEDVVCNKKNSFSSEKAIQELSNIYSTLENHVDGRVVRCEVINMNPNSRVRDHKDRSDLLYLSRRFHIPLKTNPSCFFTVNNQTVNMLEGNLYEINNIKWHNVKNLSNENRVHLIVDVLPNEYTEKIRFE
jgi:Aspartyl/Asparaginyl beta-hydroxylase